MFRSLLLTVVSVLFAAVPVFAQEADISNDKEMAEIVVTGTRYEKAISEVPANITVITEEDIDNSTAQNIPDLLRTQVGIKVSDINGTRRAYSVDLRGFGETAALNTLVLVDGRIVNQADLSGADWVQIPLDRVEKIEIMRGGRGSVLFGDNASGGVINIITKEGDKFEASASAALGSYRTNKEDISISGSRDELTYSFSGSRLSSEGYRDNSDTRAMDFGLNMSYYLGDISRVSFSSGYHKDKTGQPGALKDSDIAAGSSRTDTVNPDDEAEVEDYYYHLTPEIFFFDNDVLKIDISQRRRDSSSFNSFVGGEFMLDTEIDTLTLSTQVLIKSKFGGIKNGLTVGFDYQDSNEYITNETNFPAFPAFNSYAEYDFSKTSYGYYLYDDIMLRDRLTLSLGYRFDKADYRFDPRVVTPPPFTPLTVERSNVDEDVFTASVNYDLSGGSYVYANVARSFRYPVLDEFFNFISNSVIPDLKPQSTVNYEVGGRLYITPKAFAQVNLFMLDTDDEIFLNPTPAGFGIVGNDNMDGTTRRQGIEVELSSPVTEWLSVNGSYAYTDAKILDGQFKDNDIPDVPDHYATLGAVATRGRASFALSGIYVGERPFISDFENAFDEQDSFTVLNAKLKYSWKRLTAFIDINNLTNEKYSEYGVISIFSAPRERAYYPSPERNFLFGVSVEL